MRAFDFKTHAFADLSAALSLPFSFEKRSASYKDPKPRNSKLEKKKNSKITLRAPTPNSLKKLKGY